MEGDGDEMVTRHAERMKESQVLSERIMEEYYPERFKKLGGVECDTHNEMRDAAKALAEVTKRVQAEMGAAQERFRKAMAAHLAAITGEQVTP